ncbi:MAG TPA: LLM class F420-dependent oxidoreductase [Gaiellaceae bacterium]|nr:LLM class F420-dependent oxidoreductase [Gaiellaceae bacterium]
MRLGLALGYAPPGTNPTELVDLAVQAEALGYDSAWAAEAWGTDAVTVLAWLGARTTRLKLGAGILQIPARTPAMTAMTAATLDLMSGGRLLLGLGTSAPPVAEGWHGQAFGKPLARTREYVEIVRSALRREPLEHHGEHYELPLGDHGALKLMARPLRAEIPIYLAAIGPRNVQLATEIADGWLPIWLSPERLRDVFGEALAGAPPGFDVAAFSVPAVVDDDLQAARDSVKPALALYVGGMGTYYNALVSRYGYESEAARIKELYLGGHKRDAAVAVPDALVDEVALVGPRERVADRLEVWRDSGVTTLLVQTRDRATLRTMAELVL